MIDFQIDDTLNLMNEHFVEIKKIELDKIKLLIKFRK